MTKQSGRQVHRYSLCVVATYGRADKITDVRVIALDTLSQLAGSDVNVSSPIGEIKPRRITHGCIVEAGTVVPERDNADSIIAEAGSVKAESQEADSVVGITFSVLRERLSTNSRVEVRSAISA